MHFMALFGYESGSDIVAYLQEEIIVGKREKKEKKIRKTRKKQGIGLEMKKYCRFCKRHTLHKETK